MLPGVALADDIVPGSHLFLVHALHDLPDLRRVEFLEEVIVQDRILD